MTRTEVIAIGIGAVAALYFLRSAGGAVAGAATKVNDAVWGTVGSAAQAVTGKEPVTLTSDVLYGSQLTPYGVAYAKWMREGKKGPAPQQKDYPGEFSLWDRVFNQINL